MIGFHSHTFPNLHNDWQGLETSVEMERVVVTGGTIQLTFPPYIYPKNYNNSTQIADPVLAGISSSGLIDNKRI